MYIIRQILKNITKETFSRKLALTLLETGTINYENKEIEEQILAFLNRSSIKKERDQESYKLEELAQKLVEEIKEKLI
ncbi:9059_t:CDS:2 [Gigaspora margarita]|uniref:9059_t:CDS:1 n=1 Tax=Gigaspora margarita TaxID=4874 RepID=A0ABN7VC71_GIGMA|nr:9059_t:CDS:2 [Gigaspora margarita]